MPQDATKGDGQGFANDREASGEVFVFPASFAQQRLWIIDQMDPGRPTYNVPINVRITGRLDVSALEASFTYVVERHEALRTVFETEDGTPVQVVLPPARVVLPVVDLQQLPVGEQDTEVTRLLYDEGNRAFDLRVGPLLRVTLLRLASESHVLLLTVHHIVFDGWSTGVLQREISAAYGALSQGGLPSLSELPIQYADFSVWQRDQSQGQLLAEQLAYWTDHLRHPLPTLAPLTDRPRHLAHNHVAGHVLVNVPSDTTNALLTLARRAGTTPFTVLLTAFQVLLHRYTGQDDIIVGSPVAGRSAIDTEGLIGCFVNMLALRVDLSGKPSFSMLLDRNRTTVVAALAHQDLPFEKLVENVQPERQRTRNPIFETLFSLNDADVDADGAIVLPGLVTTKVVGTAESAKFDLQLFLNSTPDGFCGAFEFDTDLYDVRTMERLARNFVQLLQSIVAMSDRPVDELQLLSAEERHLVVEKWNATEAEYPSDRCVHELFEQQVERTPDAVAVLYEAEQLTYAALNGRANRLAHYLRAQGVGPDTCVALCVERSVEMVVGLLAVLKAGGAYVPLDTSYPVERLRFMLGDSAPVVVLTHGTSPELEALIAGLDLPVLDLATDTQLWVSERASNPARADVGLTSQHLAYVIYTSGSTGLPKGVMVEHVGVVNRLVWMQSAYQLTPEEAVLQKTPASFDVSVWEFFWPLLAGARLVVARPDGHKDPEYLATTIREHGISTLHFVPSMLRVFLDHRESARCMSLVRVICSGEVLPTALVSRFHTRLPGIELHNLYGPTEASVDVTAWACALDGEEEESRQSIPIGSPIANTQLYILDTHGEPVPAGVTGELYIGGVQVARGYLNRPVLTAERFVPDPFGPAGSRLYRTGDLGRWRADGNIEYLGRTDFQVKLRGFRIELGEIEHALRDHPAVQDAAVIAREDAPGHDATDKRLVAYYVGGEDVSAESLRTHLAAALPEHMVPAAYVRLDALPLTPNGKLDRKALPAAETIPSIDTKSYAPPRTAIEHELVHIWQALLPNRRIGIHDDFFDLGGHSLLALQMLFRIQQVRGRRLSLASVFETTTINGIGLLLESAVQEESEPAVVVLQERAAGTPFAFVHGDLHGGGWYCRRLAPLIDTESPFILFPTVSSGMLDAPVSIEAIAAAHLCELRKAQPNGPYRLGGFCVGGLIAFEMARQLQASGEVVQRLVLIDTSADNARFRPLEPLIRVLTRATDGAGGIERRAKLMRDLDYYSDRVMQVRRMTRHEQLHWLRINIARHLLRADVGHGSATEPDDERGVATSRDEFGSRPGTRTRQFQMRAASAFIPGTYTGDVDVIYCSDEPASPLERSVRMWKHVSSTVRVHTVRSSHIGLITYNLPALAQQMRACLDSREVVSRTSHSAQL